MESVRNLNDKDEHTLLRQMFIGFIRTKQTPDYVFLKGRTEYHLESDDEPFLLHIVDNFIEAFLLAGKNNIVTLEINDNNIQLIKSIVIDHFEDKNIDNTITIERKPKKITKTSKGTYLNIKVPDSILKQIADIFISLLIFAIQKGLSVPGGTEGFYSFSEDLMRNAFKITFFNELKLKSFSKIIYSEPATDKKFGRFYNLDFNPEDLEKMSRIFANKIFFGVEYPKDIEDFMGVLTKAILSC